MTDEFDAFAVALDMAERDEEQIELFAMALAGGDRNIQAACDRIIAMTDLERRDLRVALERLDGMLDALALDRHLKRK